MNYEMALVGGIVALAYWKRWQGLYFIAAASLFLVGLGHWVDQMGTEFAIPIWLLAIYTVYKAAAPWFGRG